MKTCTLCKEQRPLTDFYFRRTVNRYFGSCKFCESKKNKAYFSQQLAKKHSAIWWSARYRHLKNRAIKNGKPFSLTLHDFKNIHSTETCFYCSELCNPPTIDRKDNRLGYSKDNCVVACRPCNSVKGHMEVLYTPRLLKILDKLSLT